MSQMSKSKTVCIKCAGGPVVGKSMDRQCYQAWWRLKNDQPPKPREIRRCSYPGCGREHYAHGLCIKHRSRVVRTGSRDHQPRQLVGHPPLVCEEISANKN